MVVFGQAHDKAGLIQTQQNVLGDGLRGYQHKVLMHHADTLLDGVARRPQVDGLAGDLYRAAFGPGQPGQHVHQRALASAIFPQQSVDLARAQVKIHVINGQHAREPLDNTAHLDSVTNVRGLIHERSPGRRDA